MSGAVVRSSPLKAAVGLALALVLGFPGVDARADTPSPCATLGIAQPCVDLVSPQLTFTYRQLQANAFTCPSPAPSYAGAAAYYGTTYYPPPFFSVNVTKGGATVSVTNTFSAAAFTGYEGIACKPPGGPAPKAVQSVVVVHRSVALRPGRRLAMTLRCPAGTGLRSHSHTVAEYDKRDRSRAIVRRKGGKRTVSATIRARNGGARRVHVQVRAVCEQL